MSSAVCRGKTPFTNEEKKAAVRVQWDPERSPKLGMLPYRSIQIGIGRSMSTLYTSFSIFIQRRNLTNGYFRIQISSLRRRW